MGWLETAIGLAGTIIAAASFYLARTNGDAGDKFDHPTVEPSYSYRGPTNDWLIVRFITQNNSQVRWEITDALLNYPAGAKIINEKTIPVNGIDWDPGEPDPTKIDLSSLTNCVKFGRILAPRGTGSRSMVNGESERVEDAIWIHLPFHLRSDRLSITLSLRSKEATARLSSAEIKQIIPPSPNMRSQ